MTRLVSLERGLVLALFLAACTPAAQQPVSWEASLSDGIAAIKSGRPANAIELLLPLSLETKAFPAEDVRRLEISLALATAYQTQGHLDQAEPLYLEAIRAMEAGGGRNGAMLAMAFDNLGRLRLEEGCWAEAQEFLEKARDLYLKTWNAGDPHIANVNRSLGESYLGQGRIVEAVAILQQAVEALRQAPEVGTSMLPAALRSLATVYTVQGRYSAAKALLEESLELNREAGERQLELADGFLGLGHLYLLERNTARALPLLEKALRIFESHQDSHLPGALGELGSAALQEKKYAIAKGYLGRALDISRSLFGWDHVAVALLQGALAEAYFGERNYGQAEALIQEAIATDEDSLGKAHFTVARLLLLEATIEARQRRAPEADAHYRRALDIFRNAFSADHPVLVEAQREYSQFTKSLRR